MISFAFLDKLGSLPERALAALKNPSANPAITIIVIILAVVGLLLVLTLIELLLALFFPGKKKKGEEQAGRVGEPERETRGTGRKKERWWRRLTVRERFIIILFLGTSVTGGALMGSSQPEFCSSCHPSLSKQWVESPHAETDCVACHRSAGVIGYVAGKVSLLRMTAKKASGSYALPIRAHLKEDACSSCHRAVLTRTIVSNSIRVSHKELVLAGYACGECHGDIAHRGSDRSNPRMAQCAGCHDGKKASLECSTCHSVDVGVAPRKASYQYEYPKVALASGNCQSCHTEPACDNCHGVRLPHPETWEETAHAKEAAFEGRKRCEKCHGQAFCGECHKFPGHADGWKVEHRTDREGAKSCESCHRSDKERDFCGLCHDPTQELKKPL
ncbi:MAG: NapC/NirT family cytochrome c [Candidatus Aquicultorales bacterium]